MCDTLVALASATKDGAVYFAKNSDREPNEAQSIVRVPAKEHSPGSSLKCTYISIPQVEHTHAVLLSKPFWIWGAEMGANDQGVVIGNEAVFTKVPQEKEPGLIGMDLLRLGLERADTAYDALLIITALLEQYGQSGNCGYQHNMVYHNSFLICDRKEAWVLETAGRQWAAQRVKDARSISNCLSIGKEWDLASDDLVNFARDKKWCSSRSDFDFAGCYSDFLYTTFSDSRSRYACTMNELTTENKKIELSSMMNYLRSHVRGAGIHPVDKGMTGASVCMHAGWGPIRVSQTTGSLISRFHTDAPDTYWATHSAAPCTGIFTPLWLDTPWEEIQVEPTGVYQSNFDFWEHEVLHRSILLDYRNRMPLIQKERDEMEEKFRKLIDEMMKQPADKREQVSRQLLQEARLQRQSWTERVQKQPANSALLSLYQSAWSNFNRSANLKERIH
jgi:dipeptidase